MNLADNLKKIRKDNNLSQEQLAEKLGVSRQAVSKWESNQAYPEMDKVLQLCKMFNLNIDDLLNQDIKKKELERKSKLSLNKYIDDFLSFITKAIELFSKMSFKSRLKCIFENIIGIELLTIFFIILYFIFKELLGNIFSIFPNGLYIVEYIIYPIFKTIHIILSLIVGTVLLLHLFKVRYLDYYDNYKENLIVEEKHLEIEEKTSKINLDNKQEKIIIRDIKHHDYKFISGILKLILLFIKLVVLFISTLLSISLVILVSLFISSFLIVKSGLFFIGMLLILLSSISINTILLIVLFNFILNKKNNSKKLLIIFIISLLLFGIGLGIGAIGFTEFNYVKDTNNINYKVDEVIIPMKDTLIFDNYYILDEDCFIEENRNDIRIVFKHSITKEFNLINNYNDHVIISYYDINENFFKEFRRRLNDINNKTIIDYDKYEVYIYASKENINILKQNKIKYLEKEDIDYQNRKTISDYERKIYDLENELTIKEEEINRLNEELNSLYSNE